MTSATGISIGIVPIRIRLVRRTSGAFLTPEVPSLNGLLGVFEVGGFLLAFAPFLVDARAQV